MITKRTLTIALGLLAVALAGLFAEQYTSQRVDPHSRCYYFPEDCRIPDPVATQTAVAALWGVEVVGFVLVLVGLLWMPRMVAGPEPERRPAPVAVHAAVVGVVGAVVFAVGGLFVVFQVLLLGSGQHAALASFCVLWLVEIGLINAIDRWLGSAPRAPRWTALFALFAFAAVGGVLFLINAGGLLVGSDGAWALVVLHGACLAVGVLTVRRGPVAGLVGLGVVGLVVAGMFLIASITG